MQPCCRHFHPWYPQLEQNRYRMPVEEEKSCRNTLQKYDMGWQKQEKVHNSSTGQAAVMGLTYGKVMD